MEQSKNYKYPNINFHEKINLTKIPNNIHLISISEVIFSNAMTKIKFDGC